MDIVVSTYSTPGPLSFRMGKRILFSFSLKFHEREKRELSQQASFDALLVVVGIA